jgi:hypothetical protein
MENDVKVSGALEDTLVHGPGRVKRGLLWLESEAAKEMGLSLDRLMERAVVGPFWEVEAFNLAYSPTCAIGYASPRWAPKFHNICEEKGAEWMADHGFYVVDSDDEKKANIWAAYEALTEEWRTQLRAVLDERRPA